MELTKSQSRNLRKTIASSSGPIPADQLTLLQEYRTSYRHDLSSVFAELQKICAICTGKSILTFRLKRIESIISKIRRYPTMELTAIGDIAGCRIILNKAKDIDRVCSQIESDAYFVVKKEKDYVKNTKDSGYRSVHYIVHLPDSKKRIEVQVRTCGQHNWATFVETIDFLYGIKVKESIDDGSVKYEDFIKLHNNLSGCFEGIMPLTYEGKKEVIDTVHKYDVLGTLIEKFCDNYLRVREQWLNMLEESNLFLIQAFVDRPPLIMGFSDFELAESAYFNFYKDGFDGNMVIARIPDATYDDIRSAYPSYILTHHAFFETYFSIFEKFLKESVVNSSLTHTIRYYILYNKQNIQYLDSLNAEVDKIGDEILLFPTKAVNKFKTKEWSEDLLKQVRSRYNKVMDLDKHLISNVVPLYKRMFFIIFLKKRMEQLAAIQFHRTDNN